MNMCNLAFPGRTKDLNLTREGIFKRRYPEYGTNWLKLGLPPVDYMFQKLSEGLHVVALQLTIGGIFQYSVIRNNELV